MSRQPRGFICVPATGAAALIGHRLRHSSSIRHACERRNGNGTKVARTAVRRRHGCSIGGNVSMGNIAASGQQYLSTAQFPGQHVVWAAATTAHSTIARLVELGCKTGLREGDRFAVNAARIEHLHPVHPRRHRTRASTDLALAVGIERCSKRRSATTCHRRFHHPLERSSALSNARDASEEASSRFARHSRFTRKTDCSSPTCRLQPVGIASALHTHRSLSQRSRRAAPRACAGGHMSGGASCPGRALSSAWSGSAFSRKTIDRDDLIESSALTLSATRG